MSSFKSSIIAYVLSNSFCQQRSFIKHIWHVFSVTWLRKWSVSRRTSCSSRGYSSEAEKLFDNAPNTSENCSTRFAVTLRTFCKYCSCSVECSSVPGIYLESFLNQLAGVIKKRPIAVDDSMKDGTSAFVSP